MNNTEKKQVLLVENEFYLGRTLVEAVKFNLNQYIDIHLTHTFNDAIEYSKLIKLDLVICELQIGQYSGIDLIERVKQEQPELRSILITNYSGFARNKNAYKMADGYLTKPFELNRLFNMIRKFTDIGIPMESFEAAMNVTKKDIQQTIESPAETNKLKNGNGNGNGHHKTLLKAEFANRILVMDDDANLRRIYRKGLRKGNFEIFEAETLQQARDLLDLYHFDLFICDVHLGRERGTDILDERKKQLKTAGTTTIMVSAYGQYRMLAKEMGADYFLDKPISIGSLLHLVSRILDKSTLVEQATNV